MKNMEVTGDSLFDRYRNESKKYKINAKHCKSDIQNEMIVQKIEGELYDFYKNYMINIIHNDELKRKNYELWCIENLFIDEQNDELGDILRFSGTFYFFQIELEQKLKY